MIIFYIVYNDLSVIKGKIVDHIIKEVGETSLLYNRLRVDGYNVCITKMMHVLSLTGKP